MDTNEIAIQKHTEWEGKIEVIARAPVGSKEELAIAYLVSVISDLRQVCPLWKVSVLFSRLSVM